MAAITGILFDKDGTLFDFQASWSRWLLNLIQDLSGGDPDLERALADRLGFDLAAGRFLPSSLSIAGSVADQAAAIAPLLPAFGHGVLMEVLIEAAAEAEMVAVENLPGLLSDLRGAGLKLGVATNDAEIAAQAHLARAGIADAFDYVAGFDSGYGAKPDPGMCLGFADKFGLDPAQIVMVGDSSHDLIAARAAGMMGIGVLTGVAGADDLAPYAHVVLPDVSHLPNWLRKTA